MATTLDVNGKAVSVNAGPDTPLLWVLRDELGMTGTKFGCGVAQCGACTVLADGAPIRSCSTPISALGAAKISSRARSCRPSPC
jgi:isoquinoline 1-oxidoreductase alpha subunit